MLSAGHAPWIYTLGDQLDESGRNLLVGTFTLGGAVPAPSALALL